MRHRISVLAEGHGTLELALLVEAELGIEVPSGYNGSDWRRFCRECELKDLFDFVTILYQYLLDDESRSRRQKGSAKRWLDCVSRVLSETDVHYVIDAAGGVHLQIDEEFSRNHLSALASLSPKRHGNIVAEFRQVQAALDELPPNGKEAVRKAFTAVEGIFRLLCPRAPRLGAVEVQTHLAPLVQQLTSDAVDRRASGKLLAALADWVDAVHFYRHEQGSETIAQPEIGLAVSLISIGASHLRWLAELDERQSADADKQDIMKV